jgi:predicted unusual protein kinase regulating ubiquinone biosynthesis (AarF/ABC1/UbiB family)
MNWRFALRLRRGKAAATAEPITYDPEVVRPMPRRKVSHSIDTLHVSLPRARRVTFKPGIILPIGRLFLWLWAIIQFYFGNLVDVLQRRSSVERRAARLRAVFEDLGGSFLKLAQQLSIRVDMLPYAYCAELSKMLDRVPAFPTSEAIAIIERNLGQPLGDVFEVFDPEPIGSASLACVYQARLKSGERVAVKVRRPGIGPLIAADLRALDWLLVVGETLTIIPPDVGRRFTEDFRTILFNEMNFRAEARYTDLFRRRAARRKKDVTAPKVYFPYCTEEVMVSEFVSGVWMWELLAAVDRNDQEFLSRVAQIGIEPKALASKLVVIMLRESQEELFFHADPHPANLVIMPNNKVCFIDFGAIGRFSTATRKIFRELRYHMSKGDIGRIVNTALSLAGPLPPMDIDKVRNEMEKIYSDWVYAMNSRDAEWWEKSTGQAWLRFLEVARQYSLPASYESITYFRTSFSYDSIITRLNRDIDIVKEFETYARQAGKEARERVKKNMKQRLRGPTDLDYLQMEEFADMITQFFFQVQRNIETPIIHFKNIVGKIAYIASLVLKLGYFVAAAIGVGLVADAIAKRWFGHEIDWHSMLERATTFGWIQLALIAVLLVLIRRIVIRLSLPDTRLDRDR